MDMFNVKAPEVMPLVDPSTERLNNKHMVVRDNATGRYLGYVVPPENGGCFFSAIAEFEEGKRKKSCGAFQTPEKAAQVLRDKFKENPAFCNSRRSPTRRTTAYRKLAKSLVSFYDKEIMPRVENPKADTAGFLACWVALGAYLPPKYKRLLEEESRKGE